MGNLVLIILAVVCLWWSSAEAKRDAYAILGVPRKASARNIKKAFREMSRQYHPDKNQDNPKQAEEKFKDVAWAYEILSNETLRKTYDRFGEEGVKQQESGAPPNAGQYTFKFASSNGQPFPGGDFLFGSPFFKTAGGAGHPFVHMGGAGSPFGARAPRPPNAPPPRLTPVDWFNDSPVELVEGKVDFEDMDEAWPDLFFLFRDDKEETEILAREVNTVAEELRSLIEVQALDCRRPNQLCQRLQMSKTSFEFQLVTGSDFEKKVPNSHRPVLHGAKKKIDAGSLYEWVSNNMPTTAKTLNSLPTLDRFLRTETLNELPVAILMTEGEKPSLSQRKLMAEASRRIKFGYVPKTSRNSRFRNELVDKFSLSPAYAEPYLIHVADPDFIRRDSIELLSTNENSMAIDLTFAKWVAMKRGKGGIYQIASRALKQWTRQLYDNGVCGPKDSRYCLIYFAPRPDSEHLEKIHSILTSSSAVTAAVQLVWLDSLEESRLLRQGFGVSGTEGLVAYRPKRQKLLVYSGDMKKAPKFIESVLDGSALQQRGKALGVKGEFLKDFFST